MDKEFLNIKEVAEKLGIKPVTSYKWLREGKLKGTYFKIGGVYRFDRLLLEEYIKNMLSQNA